ncbi:MAG: hypothetical protein WC621_01675 [Patescibacteria group bacterium]
MKDNRYLLTIAAVAIIFTVSMSVLSLIKLLGLADSNSIVLRIVNRDIVILSLAVFSIVVYLWRKD